MSTLEIIKNIVEINGILVDENGDLSEMDSIMFVQTIVDIEIEFGISIPDAFLRNDNYPNIDSLACMVQEVLNASKENS